MREVAVRIVAGGEPPAALAIALVALRIGDAVRAIDADMAHVEIPVIGVMIAQPTWVDAAEGVMGKKQRPPIGHSERQLDAVPGFAVEKATPGSKAAVIHGWIDGMPRR